MGWWAIPTRRRSLPAHHHKRLMSQSVPGRQPAMSTIHRPTRPNEGNGAYVPVFSPEERTRRNRDAMALLESWATEGDEEEQRETMAVLREALGENRSLSSRALFP